MMSLFFCVLCGVNLLIYVGNIILYGIHSLEPLVLATAFMIMSRLEADRR